MTVKELINELRNMPQDKEVVLYCWADGWLYSNDLSDVNIGKNYVCIYGEE